MQLTVPLYHISFFHIGQFISKINIIIDIFHVFSFLNSEFANPHSHTPPPFPAVKPEIFFYHISFFHSVQFISKIIIIDMFHVFSLLNSEFANPLPPPSPLWGPEFL